MIIVRGSLAVTLSLLAMGTVAQQQLATPPAQAVQADVWLGKIPGGPNLRFIDLNGDALPDRLSFAADGTLSIALNNGARWFEPVVQDLPRVIVSSLLAADLDGDRHLDLYLASPAQNVVLLGDGTGRFVDGTQRLGLGDDREATGVERVDMDGDGFGDILLHNKGGDVVFWATGTGSYERSRQTPPVELAAESSRPAGSPNGSMTLSELLAAMAYSGLEPLELGNRLKVRIDMDAKGNPVLDIEAEREKKPSGSDAVTPGPKVAQGADSAGASPPDLDASSSGKKRRGNKFGGNDDPGNGVPSNVWSLFGNRNTSPGQDYLGTSDPKDLVVRTNDLERMRVLAAGDIDILKSLSVGLDLDVAGIGRFNNPAESTSTTGGSLVVAGGTGVAKRLNVGGDGRFAAEMDVDGLARFNDGTESGSTTTGAVVAAGGIGVAKRLNVGGDGRFAAELDVGGDTSISSSTQSMVPSDGALTVTGGVGVGMNLNVGGDFKVDGDTVLEKLRINTTLMGPDNVFDNYPVRIEGGNQGIAIRVRNSRNMSNNYVSFWDPGGMHGRIEGQTLDERTRSPEYIYETTTLLLDEALAAAEVIAATTSSTACGGFGACVTVPIPSLIVVALLDVANAAQKVIAYQIFTVNNIGVTYESGAGDYAEWLRRADPDEKMVFGEIVGVHGGRISKRTQGAETALVVSFKPAVLGNMPPEGTQHLHEKVAFMGQVPVLVRGPVAIGDHIVPSGRDDGLGVAVPPDELTLEQAPLVVGRAWQRADDADPKLVNVVVGLGSGEWTRILERHAGRIFELERRLDVLEAQSAPQAVDQR